MSPRKGRCIESKRMAGHRLGFGLHPEMDLGDPKLISIRGLWQFYRRRSETLEVTLPHCSTRNEQNRGFRTGRLCASFTDA